MLRVFGNYLKIVPKRHCNMLALNDLCEVTQVSKLLYRTLSYYDIRHQFLDYFIETNDHTTIRSRAKLFISIYLFSAEKIAYVPLSELFILTIWIMYHAFGSVYNFQIVKINILERVASAAVNFERNQLKNLFHGKMSARIGTVDSRKYVSVGGEQNELCVVGTGSHHSSLHEMLGNWSFSEDFKKGASELARNLFNGPCRNNSSGLYFNDSNESLEDFVDIEMKDVLENSPKQTHPFIVHFLTCATVLESVHLQRATRLCTDRPIIVLSSTDDQIKARCCVPRNFVRADRFSAYLWLATVANAFETELCSSPSERNMDEVCHMKPKKLTSVIFDERLETAMHQASDFAKINM